MTRSSRQRPMSRARDGQRGAALILVMMMMLMLGTMSVMAMQTTSVDQRIAESAKDESKLADTAYACASQVHLFLQSGGPPAEHKLNDPRYMIPSPSSVDGLPNAPNKLSANWPSGTEPAPKSHPLIGHCWAINTNCNPGTGDLSTPPDGVNEDYCCCRTGYLFGQSGRPFAYDRTNANHRQVVTTGALPNDWFGAPGAVGAIQRFGTNRSHFMTEAVPEMIEDKNGPCRQRYYVTIAAASRLAVREYEAVFAYEGNAGCAQDQ